MARAPVRSFRSERACSLGTNRLSHGSNTHVYVCMCIGVKSHDIYIHDEMERYYRTHTCSKACVCERELRQLVARNESFVLVYKP